MNLDELELTRARESRAAIERLYIEMRHLVNHGSMKQLGLPGEVITDALKTLRPEIYGDLTDPDRVELDGLVYVIDRLPKGIEEVRFIKLISEEGFAESDFEVIVPKSRRRNCFRIDKDRMYIEVTRGRSDVYDILTHLTFMYIEARKIKDHVLDELGNYTPEWLELEQIIQNNIAITDKNCEVALTYLSSILGQTFHATQNAYKRLNEYKNKNNGLFHVVYFLGKISIEEEVEQKGREITFSPALRGRMGHHIYGERWAQHIKHQLREQNLLGRPIHIISANMHSTMNTLYAWPALEEKWTKNKRLVEVALLLAKPENRSLRKIVEKYALANGMYDIPSDSNTHISVQVFDTAQLPINLLCPELKISKQYIKMEQPIIIVMDYAFGEQAFESMDELLKPYKSKDSEFPMPVHSISMMGKAGILAGGKGDIMVPTAHIFEGTADNYPINNDFRPEDFDEFKGDVYEGPMITVLGTSLQNRDVLEYFLNSSWNAIGLEMEGAHYQKAIQAQAKIRKNIREDVILRYAYYASDNPLITGSTLASGSLGEIGVMPTYTITLQILNKILTTLPKGVSEENSELNATTM